MNVRHGQTGTRAYRAWSNMKTRCTNPKNKKFKDYGGRGITVCARWLKFDKFFEDMGQPAEGMTLERQDVDGNYTPGNCIWAPLSVQARNKRCVPLVDGQRRPKREIAKSLGLSRAAVNQRLRYGWTLERAISEPKRGSH